MRTEDFDFELDPSLIAQTPIKNRSDSKLLILDKKNGTIIHECFKNIINYLDSNDCLVLNNTKVIPARLHGTKMLTNAFIEVLLLKDLGNDTWESLAKPARRVNIDDIIVFSDKLKAKCIEVKDDGIRVFKLLYDGILMNILDELGEMPLPPYIKEKLKDKDRYQTVYAKYEGSAAAPTAGLHFTKELLEEIKNKGVEIVYVTLHVGLGTFRPVMEDDIKDHKMHEEFYIIDKEASDKLNEALRLGKRIISVGTTSTRTLESAYDNGFKPCSKSTDIFIYPGYKFKVVNALITNFHLPKSTLVMLVSALAGKDNIMHAYKEAMDNKYRFFSFGDAMFIK
ncbi:MAG: tRNA preQ1(34) S-adenosylmethionine ribosyltransferase-isomerase QueA [Acholeplasmatales bacterium]|nr:tRNA preQ1(34) S-adenosylmethionine ribosyltransferase-isomerase QueA [Acholeplasmatales bacterium]